MDSNEILRQYMMGAIKASSAIKELEQLIYDSLVHSNQKEAARARYVIGFIRRYLQYLADNASVFDICLNIRDLTLVLGRTTLNERLYSVVKKYGSEFDLVCENDLQVSCLFHSPEWLHPSSYIRDVYSLKQTEDAHNSELSSGDELLRENTEFSAYKSFEQKVSVHTALSLPAGHTLLISQPTGGGKSLVTQILASTSTGLTIVIVPTVALARDQYHAARQNLKNKKGIYCYRGSQSVEERKEIIKGISEKTARILFISPEAILMNTALYTLLEKASSDKYLVNVVIDEAHVVPDWGVFFRPDFQIFSILLRKWRKLSNYSIRTFMLSATLSDDVVDTLFTLFGSETGNAQIRCDSLRNEPRFYFHSTKSKKEQDDKTIEAIKTLPKPAVVYVLEPKEAKDLQKRFKAEGFSNIPTYTGETNDDEREKVLLGWKSNEYDIVIATSAFGIGVDKPDVRTIIHACCPENLSRYYQEVGRSGRDGLPSISLFLPYQSKDDKNADVRRALGLVKSRVLTVERAVIRWNGMLSSPNSFIDIDECVLDSKRMAITKTDFMRGMQCPKMLWLDKHRPDLKVIPPEIQASLDAGNDFGDEAMRMFGPFEEMTVYRPGTTIPDKAAMVQRTQEHLAAGTPVICEAAFSNYNNYCAVDILRKTESGYDFYEVKNAPEVYPQFVKDAGFQYYIMARCKMSIGKIFIVIHGPDENEPFVPVEVTKEAKGYYTWINDHIWDLNRMQKEPKEVSVEPGDQCSKPYECWYYGYCHDDL